MQRGERSPAEPSGEGSGQRVKMGAAAIIAKTSLRLGAASLGEAKGAG